MNANTPDTEQSLYDEYGAYLAKHDLPELSADELQSLISLQRINWQRDEASYQQHKAYLTDFIARWDAVMEAQDAARGRSTQPEVAR